MHGLGGGHILHLLRGKKKGVDGRTHGGVIMIELDDGRLLGNQEERSTRLRVGGFLTGTECDALGELKKATEILKWMRMSDRWKQALEH